MSRTVTLVLLALLVVAHLALASWYAGVTPYRTGGAVLINPSREQDIGAPDERQHVNYVAHIANGQGFPVFNPQDPNQYENYQSHQPPLFYVLSAGWAKLTGVSEFEDRTSGLKLRFLNSLLGCGTVVGVFFLGFWGFQRKEVGLLAAVFAGLLPMMLALSSAVSNDPLLILLCTWVLALCARAMREGWSTKTALLVGLLTGLALLTKTTALALLPAILVAALIPQEKKPSLKMAATAAALAIVLVAPWWARNQHYYHDPLAIGVFNQAFRGSAQKSTILEIIRAKNPSGSPELSYWVDWVGWWTARSFFGVFGYMDIWLNATGQPTSHIDHDVLYRLLIVGFLLCLVGWLAALGKDEWKSAKSVQWLNGTFLLVVFLLFIRFDMQYFQAQARYLLPALGPISCGIAVGLVQLTKNRAAIALAILSVVLLGVNIYALGRLPEEFDKRIDIGHRMA